MSVVSLARITGLTFDPAKALRRTSRSRLLTEVSMMSTTSWRMIASIELEELFAGAQPGRGPVLLSRRPDGVQAGAHIGIFRVRDDEVRAPVIARTDPRELFIEPEHGEPPPGHRSRL